MTRTTEFESLEWAARRGWRLILAQNGVEYLVRGPFPQIGPDQGMTIEQNFRDYLDYIFGEIELVD